MALLMDWRTCERQEIRGLDHLGVSAFSIAVYNILLPGVTNVTDRARYYSFYPWVIHAYADAARTEDRRRWLTWFRRLDFAYALASVAADQRGHGSSRGVVGADKARAILRNAADTSVHDLRPAADLDEDGKVPKGAYFKNSQGGYGQYYKAVLRTLGILFEHEEYEHPNMQLTTYAGLPLAKSVDSQQAFKRLLDIAHVGTATLSDLADVGAQVGPSAIAADSQEHDQLCGLFWGEDESLCRAESLQNRQWRRSTLVALLSFIDATHPTSDDAVGEYRRACAGSRIGGVTWQPPDKLAPVIRGWADYQWNEYFNFAMESLLWASVQLLDNSPRSAARLVTDITELMIAGLPPQSGDVESFVRNTATGIDPRTFTAEELYAASLESKITRCIRAREIDATVGAAAVLLGHLVSVPSENSGQLFSSVPGITELFVSHRIHLPAWRGRVRSAQSQRLDLFFRQLIMDWVVNRHLRVATRKLAAQGVHTFKFAPVEDVLIRLAGPGDDLVPGLTNPRLRQGLQVLQDLGFINEDADRLVLTPLGVAKLGVLQ